MRDHIQKEKAASETGGSLNFYISISSTRRRLFQENDFQSIGYLTQKIIQEAAIKGLNSHKGAQNDK